MQPVAPLENAKAKSRTPRNRRFLTMCLILIIGLVCAYFAVDWFQDSTHMRHALAETEARDPGWRLQDLEAQRAPVADEENGALQILAASKLLARPLPSDAGWAYVESAGPRVQLNEVQLDRLRDEMRKDVAALALSAQLADLPRGRYPVTWTRTSHEELPSHVEVPREITWLLHADALLRAADGDLDGAMTSFCSAWNAARSFGDEPFLHSQRVRLGCRANALSILARILGQGEPSVAAMHKAIACILLEDPEPLLLIAWRGERATLYELMEAHRSGEIRDATSLELSRRDVEARALDLLTRMVEIAKLPHQDQLAPLKEIVAELTAEPDRRLGLADVNAKNCLSTLYGFRSKYLREKARLRCAAVALAAESYRTTHDGRWPERLADVAPEFIAELPLDPYDAQPLRFRIHDDNIVIYSVGPDLMDDDGHIDDPDPMLCTDIGIRLWNVPKRHQAPEPPVMADPNVPK